MGNDRTLLAQIRERIAAVIIPHADTIKRVKVGSSKGRSCDRQSDGLVQALETGQTDPAVLGLIGMSITKTPAAFYAFSERRVVATMRNQIPIIISH